MDNDVTLDHADDEIAGTWNEILARNEDAADEAEPAAPVAEAAPAAEVVETTAAERARDEAGKFAKQPKAAPVKAAPAAAPAAPAPADPTAPAAADSRDVTSAPSSWKPAAKAAYAGLPPEIKAEIHRRESDFLAGQSQLMPDARFGKAIKDAAAPFQAILSSEGASVDQAFSGFLNLQSTLRVGTQQAKAAKVVEAIRHFGISLDEINAQLEVKAPPAQQPQNQEFKDPRFDRYLAEQEQRETEQIVSAIDRWKGEADAQGQPLRPFADNVMGDMVGRVPAIKAGNPGISHDQALTKAYEDAVWANPETRQLKLNELEAKRREESLRTVNDAKKAASVNVPRRGAPPAAATVAPFGSAAADDQIRETARTLGLIS